MFGGWSAVPSPDFVGSSGRGIVTVLDGLLGRVVMKRFVASLCLCWGVYCGAPSNTAPLAFGMTIDEAAAALGVPLLYYSGDNGSEIYLAYGQAGVLSAYPVASALALQFRNGRLTGWKKDWQTRPN
jgi:hypothetical protein